MKSLKYIPILLLFLSCKSKYVLTNTLEIDAKTDKYVAVKVLKQELADYELKASITFNESYRRNKTGWAGFLLNTNSLEGVHGKDSGYLFFIRENGEVGLHSSGKSNKKLALDKHLRSLEYGKRVQLKIISSNSKLTIYINGKQHFQVKDLQLDGKYFSANAGGASASIKIKSVKTTVRK